MTITEAAQTVLRDAGKPLSVQKIYDEIIKRNLYSFGAKNPKSVLSQTIKEKSDANPKSKSVMFKAIGQGTYALVD